MDIWMTIMGLIWVKSSFAAAEYYSIWGQPDSTAFTRDTWTLLSQELVQWSWFCTQTYTYVLYLNKETPLYGLLQSDMRNRLSWVNYGTIDVADLYSLKYRGHLTYTLRYTRVMVAASYSERDLKEIKEELFSVEPEDVLLSPDFIQLYWYSGNSLLNNCS